MFTVIYDKRDGRVLSIMSGTYSDEDFLEAYGDNVDKLETKELISVTPFRQYLVVKDKQLIAVTEELSPEKEKYVRQLEISTELTELKNFLVNTDYTVIKCSELGLNYSETYPEISMERAKARTRINELEAELESIDMSIDISSNSEILS